MKLVTLVSMLTRDQLIEALKEADETTLRAAAVAALSTPAEPAAPPAAPAKAAKGKAAPAAAPKAGKPAAAKPGAAKPTADDKVKVAITELAKLGFAAGDLAEVTGLDSKSSGLRTALKNAMAAGELHSFGEKRFTRYGKTAAIAQKASEKARTGG